MRLRRIVLAAATTGALLVVLAVQAGGASAASYELQGSYSFAPTVLIPPFGPGCDVIDVSTGCGRYSYEGTATCRQRCANAPQSGLFTLDLRGGSRIWPQNACVSQQVVGQLDFSPNDPYLPIATTVSGNNVSDRGFNLRSSPNDPYKGTIVSFVSRPADPCSPGGFTGTVELPPNPI